MKQINELEFQVAFGAVRHFGRNLYTTNPPAIAELVANAWDAYAKKCIVLYTSSSMAIIDDGIGMTDYEFQTRYATSGNEKDTDIRKPESMKERPYMGKKGIGKFSAFSLADEYILFTKSEEDNDWKQIHLKKEILEVKDATVTIPINRVNTLEEISKEFNYDFNNNAGGTIIYLPKLSRNITSATIASLKKLLAHRFSITTIINDGNFEVEIGDREDRGALDLKTHFFDNDIEYVHYFGTEEESIKKRFTQLGEKYIVKEKNFTCDVKGWVASVSIPASLVVEDETAVKGVSIYINGKLVDEDILRTIKKDRMTDAYIIGEIDANYLGTLTEDVVLSNREGLFLDNSEVKALKTYVETIRKNLVSQWDEMRSLRNMDKNTYIQRLISRVENQKYYDALGENEKKRFNKYAQKLFDKPNGEEDDSLINLANLMFSALLQIVNDETLQNLLNKGCTDEVAIMECFSKIFNLAEVNHALRLRDSIRNNLNIIDELEKYICSGEVEKVFEKHLENNPWLIEPTWITKIKSVHSQNYYSLLNIDNDNEDRLYTDLVVEVSDESYPIIIEIKREKATNYSMPDVSTICTQLYKYKKAMAQKLSLELGKHIKADEIKTYFICGQKAWDKLDVDDRDRLRSNGINLRSYDELIRTSKQIFAVNFGEDIVASLKE